MKHALPSCLLVLAALTAGNAIAGDSPRSDTRDALRDDTDGDGKISRAEATAAGATRSGEWFDKLDLDKDGFVTSEEIRQARETRRASFEAEMKAKTDEKFKEADVNGDGQLTLEEVKAKLPRLADRFQMLDKDKNGTLSRDELTRFPHDHGRHPEPQT